MFLAHLPAGYIATRFILGTTGFAGQGRRSLYLAFGSLCSILPDADLLYFYTLGARQYPHHTYWTHMPVFWLVVAVSVFLLGRLLCKRDWSIFSLLLLCNTWLHLLLDSVAGGIYWLFPLNDHYFRVFTITARYDWWVFNYVLHWTFLLELIIISGFAWLLWRDFNSRPYEPVAEESAD